MSYKLFVIICNRIEVSGEKQISVLFLFQGVIGKKRVTGGVGMANQSDHHNTMFFLGDLANPNSKYHMNYSIIIIIFEELVSLQKLQFFMYYQFYWLMLTAKLNKMIITHNLATYN